jgi:hypothetical protein
MGDDHHRMSPAAPWAALAELAERELSLAQDGRWDEVAACAQERVRRAAELPLPPPEARPHLERLAVLQDAIVAFVGTARAVTARELRALRRGQGATRGYAAAAGGRTAALVDGRG